MGTGELDFVLIPDIELELGGDILKVLSEILRAARYTELDSAAANPVAISDRIVVPGRCKLTDERPTDLP